jgi:hypothetical protein
VTPTTSTLLDRVIGASTAAGCHIQSKMIRVWRIHVPTVGLTTHCLALYTSSPLRQSHERACYVCLHAIPHKSLRISACLPRQSAVSAPHLHVYIYMITYPQFSTCYSLSPMLSAYRRPKPSGNLGSQPHSIKLTLLSPHHTLNSSTPHSNFKPTKWSNYLICSNPASSASRREVAR